MLKRGINRFALFTTMFVVLCGGPFGMEEIVPLAGPGLFALTLLVVPILWAIPYALITAELVSELPMEGGAYQWFRPYPLPLTPSGSRARAGQKTRGDVMRSLMPRAVLLVALSLGCNGPLPFMSGGALSGEVATTPAEWSAFPEFAVVQLETRPEDPYSVNIASTLVDGVLYINAGDTETEWVKHMEENPHVRLRNDGVLYELRSERVTDADEISRFGVAWTSHGMFHRDPSELEKVWVYRLEAR